MERRALPGCFAFGNVCAADEREWLVPGLVWLVLPKAQGREELLLKHLPHAARLSRFFSRFSRSPFPIPAQPRGQNPSPEMGVC